MAAQSPASFPQLPHSHPGSVDMEVPGMRSRGAGDSQSFQCLFLDMGMLEKKDIGRIQKGLAAGETQAGLTTYLCPTKPVQPLSPSTKRQDPLTSLRTRRHSCTSKCLCLGTSSVSVEQAPNPCFSFPPRRCWAGALPYPDSLSCCKFLQRAHAHPRITHEPL